MRKRKENIKLNHLVKLHQLMTKENIVNRKRTKPTMIGTTMIESTMIESIMVLSMVYINLHGAKTKGVMHRMNILNLISYLPPPSGSNMQWPSPLQANMHWSPHVEKEGWLL